MSVDKLSNKIRNIILDKSCVIEFVTWADDTGTDRYAYLIIKGVDYPKYQQALASGQVILEEWGVFYQDTGSKPKNEEIELLKAVFGAEAIRI